MERKLNTITDDMREKLRVGFPAEAYSSIESKSFLTTLKAIYVTERLNDVFGMGRWTIDIEIIERTPDYVLVQGTFVSLDFDVMVPKQFGGHKTTGKGTEIADGFKSALTDCQSKIASYFEIGIDMFKGKIKTYKKPYTPRPNTTSTQKTIQNTTSSAKETETKEALPWLNKMKGKDMTKEYLNVIQGVTNGSIGSIKEVQDFYRMRKELVSEIETLIKNHKTEV